MVVHFKCMCSLRGGTVVPQIRFGRTVRCSYLTYHGRYFLYELRVARNEVLPIHQQTLSALLEEP